MDTSGVLVLGVGLLVGAVIGVLVARSRQLSSSGRVEVERAALTVERDAARAESERLAVEARGWSDRAQEADREVARLTTSLEMAERAGAERLADLQRAQEALTERFRLLSQEALDRTSERLLAMTDEKLRTAEKHAGAELEQRRQAVENLVKPIEVQLEQVRAQLHDVEKLRHGAYTELREQVRAMNQTSEQLRVETASLVTALRAPQVRGRWGEMQLRRVVESAGMVEHCDFVEQAHVSTDDGALRPDLVVRLAGGKQVVVDAKVAFSGYLEAVEARDDATRAARLRAHARHLREHIDGLAAKAYWDQFQPAPEFVVMFVPAEAFLNAALDEDPTLLEHAFERNVVLATPQTLIALLRTVAYTWRQEALAANARQVYQLGRELHGRLATMGGHLAKLGTEIGGAVKAYNNTVSSLESRVLVTARRLTELQVVEDDLASPAQVEVATRQVQAPELVASATEALVLLDIETDPRYGVEPEPDRADRADEAERRLRGSGSGA
jgi:DNA recombination protein RmuC